MTELRAILDRLDVLREPAVLATVVRVSGSAYRRPGARLLLTADGTRVGMVSGGCLEADLARKAWWRTAGGPVVVRYDTGSGDDGAGAFRLGCGGVVDVLLERVDPAAPPGYLAVLRAAPELVALARIVGGAEAVGAWLTCDAAGRVSHDLPGSDLVADVTALAAAALRAGRSGYHEVSAKGVFTEIVAPSVGLVVCGGGPDVLPVVTIAQAVGWHVTVCDPRPGSGVRFAGADAVLRGWREIDDRVRLAPGGAAVAMSHNTDDDRRFLRAALASPVGYVGALGPRRRADALLAGLAADGFAPSPAQFARLHAPVGLDLGATTPEEIALAVVAEVRAALAGRSGGFLRDRHGPLHARAAAGAAPAEVVRACPAGAAP